MVCRLATAYSVDTRVVSHVTYETSRDSRVTKECSYKSKEEEEEESLMKVGSRKEEIDLAQDTSCQPAVAMAGGA